MLAALVNENNKSVIRNQQELITSDFVLSELKIFLCRALIRIIIITMFEQDNF